MKMRKREIFKNINFLYTYDFTSTIKITSPKTNCFPEYSQSN